VLPRRERDSALGRGVSRDDGGGIGLEKPTTDEAGSERLKTEAEPAS
jgi:hypothetical protein